MANYQLSTDFTNTIRDVSALFQHIVTDRPGLLPLIPTRGRAEAIKHEWLEQQSSPTTYAIASFDIDGDGTGINFASTTGMRADDILSFTKATGAGVTELVRIASVDSATDITVVRDYGSSTGVTLEVGDIAYLSRPNYEATEAGADINEEATANHNFCQILERTAKVSKTANTVGIYDNLSKRMAMLQQAIETQMRDLAWEKSIALFKGRKVERAPGSNLKGTFGGLEQFVTNTNSTGGALSYDLFNAGFQAMFEAGGVATQLACVGNIEQVRRISGFNTAGTNPVVNIGEQDSTGNTITRVIADFKLGQTNIQANVVLDPQVPKDQLYLLDLSQIGWFPLRPMISEPATPPGADFTAVRLLEETTLQVRNGAYSHIRYTGLTI